MKSLYESWKKTGVLQQEPSAAFYLIEEKFDRDGQAMCRLGFVSLLEVSDFEKKQVLPHEFTLAGPKKDRLELLRTMGAETSQIFLCYQDENLLLEKIHSQLLNKPALLSTDRVEGVARKVWRIENPQDVSKIQQLLAKQSVLIADGHHRYETAVAFAKEDQTERSRYVQAYFMNLKSPGFSILPIHRIVSRPEGMSTEDVIAHLAKKGFAFQSAPDLSASVLEDKQKKGQLAFYIMDGETKNIQLALRPLQTEEDAEIFVIQTDLFTELFGWDVAQSKPKDLRFEHTTEEFVSTTTQLPRGLGFFLPPTNLDLVMKRALRGERMPQKSTFFAPKIATGLINYELGAV
jgi:uncharacterized protein (DUF1015 family)